MQDVGKKLIVLAASVGVMLLLVPLAAMQFTDQVAWTLADFGSASALLFGAGLAYVLLTRKEDGRRVWVAMAIVLVLLIVWAELAVGVFGTPWAGS
jgi:hypothetical protein